MELVEERPNVELRRGPDGRSIVVLSFPYDPQIVASVRSIPQRRFDWDTREWWAPVDDWAGVHVAEVLDRFPELIPTSASCTGCGLTTSRATLASRRLGSDCFRSAVTEHQIALL